MRRVIIGLALGLMLTGCSKPLNDNSSAVKDAKSSMVTAVNDSIAPPSPDQADARGAVTGVAVDAEGKGVEEVTISIHRGGVAEPIATATTNAKGIFTIDNVPVASDYTVNAVNKKSIFGVRGEKQPVSVQAGETTDVGHIELKIGKKPK